MRRRLGTWVTTYRQGSKPNVAIFSMRRSGSTLLSDMLASERGVMTFNEPFFVLAGNPDFGLKSRWLRPRLHSTFFDLDDEDRERVHDYMVALLAGKVPIGVCHSPRFPFRVDRMLLKILHAAALLDWLVESFDLKAVRLLRHPAAQALSVLRKGWGFPVEAFFARPEFLLGFLDEDQVEFGNRILAGDSPWQVAILDWCVEYRILVHFNKVRTPLVTYEALTLDPTATCRSLCEQLGLSDLDRIANRIHKPSTSPGGCSADKLALIHNGDLQSLIRSWHGQVDAAMAEQAQEILDRFDVSIYSMSHHLPKDWQARIRIGQQEALLQNDRPGSPALVQQAIMAS